MLPAASQGRPARRGMNLARRPLSVAFSAGCAGVREQRVAAHPFNRKPEQPAEKCLPRPKGGLHEAA